MAISLYNIERKEMNGIKIVEINERDCNYHDFVLVYYTATNEKKSLLNQLQKKYKEQEKTVCFIGCISDETTERDLVDDFSDYCSYFDLNAQFMTYDEFEFLVLSCYSCRTGLTHGDPEDWFNLKNDESDFLTFLSKTGNSLKEVSETLYSSFDKIIKKYPNCGKMKNAVITIITNETDIPMNNELLKNVRLIDFFINGDYQLCLQLNPEYKEIEKREVIITLLLI